MFAAVQAAKKDEDRKNSVAFKFAAVQAAKKTAALPHWMR